MSREDTPFSTHYRPGEAGQRALARRPIVARALQADLVTPSQGAVLLWGEPQVGKTTLVRQVLWSLDPARFLVTRLPIGSLAEPIEGYSRALEVVRSQVAVQLDSADPPGASAALAEATTVGAAIVASMAIAEQSGRTLVLAVEGVDRYVGGVWPQGVLRSLSACLSRLPDVSLLLTSRVPLARLEAIEVPEQLRVHFLPPLDAEQAEELLLGPVKSWLSFTPDALEQLLHWAGGRPLLLQILGRNCSRLARALKRPRIASEEASEVMTSCWLSGERLFRALLANLLSNAQRALGATALATGPSMPSAKFERIHAFHKRLGGQLSLAALSNELSMLRLWRLVESDGANAYWPSCGWLAEYLRAGD